MKSAPEIAIVGMACAYADARTPTELWENVLAQRRAFRRLPSERLRAEDYFSADEAAADRTYTVEAAVIEGYEFDRVGFRVVGTTFRSADLAHWLALDIAAKALTDGGFPDGRGLPRDSTCVLVGNTLTGEFSRANALRLRWPYVRRRVDAALTTEGWTPENRRMFLDRLERDYNAPFPPPGEETLSGGLSNTIAGRICNHFDLHGGGYTVDGACASSLLAVANACTALMANDVDVALAGGVDLSLDPFEIVGFARTGALARGEMLVFDRRSTGFWPGEGCGFVTLMRRVDALAQGRRIYAVIRGWGISSDGNGGITRPEAVGQLEALRRAYRRAGFGPDSVEYCEAHGTGTPVGDATELEVLSRARRESNPNAPPAAIGSIKANIGHTKAAAGIASLIKATIAVHTQVLPPTTGCREPHALLGGSAPPLRVLREAKLWPKDRPLRASVSAMGFGGINAHVVIEGEGVDRRSALAPSEKLLSRSRQDGELFLFAANTADDLARQVDAVLAIAGRLSCSELIDLAACLQKRIEPGSIRAGIVATKPSELAERLLTLKGWLHEGGISRFRHGDGIFLGAGEARPRIGFLFPGQGSPMHLDGGVWTKRFECVRELYQGSDGDRVQSSSRDFQSREDHPAKESASAKAGLSTSLVQPAVVTASLAGLRILSALGITADAAVGHSLGEFTALHWAGAFDEKALIRIARARGAAMASLNGPAGAMLAVAAPASRVQHLLNSDPLTIVSFNSPRQTVVAGESRAVDAFARRIEAQGWQTTPLPVANAFHTSLVAAATPILARELAAEEFARPAGRVVSTITGGRLGPEEDLRELLCRQVTSPVRFDAAVRAMVGSDGDTGTGVVDLLIEVGPGTVLTELARDNVDVPALALDAGGPSLTGLLRTVGAAFALGAPVRHAELFADRFTRPFDLDWQPKFFANPCEQAPVSETCSPPPSSILVSPTGKGIEDEDDDEDEHDREGTEVPAIESIRRIVIERTELPAATVRDDSRMLSDLHLNSITVGQIVSEAARRMRLPHMVGLTEFANASVTQIAEALSDLKTAGKTARVGGIGLHPAGVGPWVHAFKTEFIEKNLPNPDRALYARDDAGNRGNGTLPKWKIFAPAGHALAEQLRENLSHARSGGVLVCLPRSPDAEDLLLLLNAGQAAVASKTPTRFVVVQHGWGCSGFARTLHLENPGLTTCVVNVPPAHPQVADWIVAEIFNATGFCEAHYTAGGRRWEARLKACEFPSAKVSTSKRRRKFPIGKGDVLLVTGGGKGIAAECALALARETGVSLALLGRSDATTDKELAANLERIAAHGIRWCYVRADVTDANAVKDAVAEAVGKLGPITAVLHGAGVNRPRLIPDLDDAAFRSTFAPKIQGARNVLSAVGGRRLRMFVTFGSIIARTGLPGEADYATANEWLTALTREFQAQHPHCRCLALEWSIWSGAGMGERLGRVESLVHQGITPITIDEGVRSFCELLARPARDTGTDVVVSGRFGEPPTLKFLEAELPLLRYLERKRVFYPGVELVVDAAVSPVSDPYLNDHVLQNQQLFPAILGLEAMAQAAMALTGFTTAPSIENVEFLRPVNVAGKSATTIRLAALRRAADLVEVCLRSGETDFQADHFRALCRFGPVLTSAETERHRETQGRERPMTDGFARKLPLDPQTELYGRILFHGERFRRLGGYRLLNAKECVVEITSENRVSWFGPYAPPKLVLGDPGARDAALHAIQACIPHLRILPTGVERILIRRLESAARLARARERLREGGHFIYDVEITNDAGELLERWEGLHLRAVEAIKNETAWPEPLVAPYIERRLEELAQTQVQVTLGREMKTDAAIHNAFRKSARVWRRPDGKPEAMGDIGVSAAHATGLTLAVAGCKVGCDLETVANRSRLDWVGLLGADGMRLAERIASDCTENVDISATRLWTATECLKKSGSPATAALVLESTTTDAWVLLRSGARLVATCVLEVRGNPGMLVFAVATESKVADAASTARPFAAWPAPGKPVQRLRLRA
jgi:enediyne polyketide synthase